ncbi:MAG TPA: ATP-binding protein [Bacteroidia bacterium]|nr:ATP-binding protein [Bacteroidia bacterium]
METELSIAVLHNEINWLQEVISQVIRSYLLQEGHEKNWQDILPPDISASESPYALKVLEWQPGVFGRIALALAIAPHLRPEALDVFFGKNQLYDRGFTEFGGVVDKNHSGFLPTAQTLYFLLTAVNPELRPEVMKLLSKENVLIRDEVIQLSEVDQNLPPLNAMLTMSSYWFEYFITGVHPPEESNPAFPAQRITTGLEWEDVVLDDNVMEQVEEIQAWLQHSSTLMNEWGLKKMLKPGYRALFYGPPGTGKTLTATLLGKMSGRDVYRIDLSMIVSKYIGETEKNLARVFAIARNKHWILFFDEADALFGKRTTTNSSNDRHANQQTAYLLQLIEDYPGVVILASNLNANIDDAFTRRFQSMIHFAMPSAEERLQLWTNAFSGTCTLHPDIDLRKIAEDHQLSGGSIINVLRTCALTAVRTSDPVVTQKNLLAGIRKEFRKENKTLIISS